MILVKKIIREFEMCPKCGGEGEEIEFIRGSFKKKCRLCDGTGGVMVMEIN